ncbi:3-oxoacyl-ACP synthase, partial [Salmonella enterica subsp. enterica serovar Agona]|nr:3-oxoacyl-ACP synthase [Salmonella enterica subsp. enterica serovar Agona]
ADNFLNAFFDSAHTLKFPIKTRFRDGFRSV